MTGWIARALALALGLWVSTAGAQGLFSPVAKVNDSFVTSFELDQRAQMLELFGLDTDVRAEAITRLIEERLQTEEAKRSGISVSEAEIVAGETEFASRAQLDREQFLAILAQNGIQPESYRDFVRAGLLWRKVVQSKFGGPFNTVSEDDVDRALGQADLAGGTRVLLTEIVLRADTPQMAGIAMTRAEELRRITGEQAFSAAATRFSVGQSRNADGKLNWIALTQLPPQVQSALSGLEVGQVTAPIRTEETVLLFMLRDRKLVPETSPATQTLDYATLLIPGGRTPEAMSQAATIAAAAQTCDDLYGIARNYPPEALQRQSRVIGELPADIAVELAKLDPGEQSLALTRNGGQNLLFLMLCDRLKNPQAELVRTQVEAALMNQQLAGKARIYLADLKANAVVEVY